MKEAQRLIAYDLVATHIGNRYKGSLNRCREAQQIQRHVAAQITANPTDHRGTCILAATDCDYRKDLQFS